MLADFTSSEGALVHGIGDRLQSAQRSDALHRQNVPSVCDVDPQRPNVLTAQNGGS